MMTTRERIETAAIQLFAERGLAGAAVRDIAQSAGVADGALYRHYRSKDELYRLLFERHYTELGQRFADAAARHPELPRKINAIIQTAYQLFDRDRALFAFILLTQHEHLPGMDALPSSPVDTVTQIIEAAENSGELTLGDSNEVTAMLMGVALQPAIFTIYGRLKGPLSARANHVAAACCRLLNLPSQGRLK